MPVRGSCHAEVVIIVQHLAMKGLLDAFAHQVRLVRGRFGTYEPIDFLALLAGYAISRQSQDSRPMTAFPVHDAAHDAFITLPP